MKEKEQKVYNKTKTTNLDLKAIYEICEVYGISKEIVALFPSFERRVLDEQNNTRA